MQVRFLPRAQLVVREEKANLFAFVRNRKPEHVALRQRGGVASPWSGTCDRLLPRAQRDLKF